MNNDLQNQISNLTARLDRLENTSNIPRDLETSLVERLFPHKFLYASATLDFPSTAAGNVAYLTIGVPGASDGDMVVLGIPYADINFDKATYAAFVSADNVVSVRFTNSDTVAAINPASGKFSVMVIKQ